MAYFANSSEADGFIEQCSRCKYGEGYCPIHAAQHMWNYEACNNELARKILDHFVKDDGTCAMFEEFKEDFEIKENH